MWVISLRTKLLYLFLCLVSCLSSPVCMHPSNHAVLPLANCWKFDRFKGFGDILLEATVWVVTMFPEVFLSSTPEEFNAIQLAVKLWEKYAKMASSLNIFLNQRSLHLKIQLKWHDVSCTAAGCFNTALCILAQKQLAILPQAPLSQNLLHPFWLTWIYGMILRKDHWLGNLLSILHVPSILHTWISSSRTKIHVWNQKGICRINWVVLWIINKE